MSHTKKFARYTVAALIAAALLASWKTLEPGASRALARAATTNSAPSKSNAAARSRISEAYNKLPLRFEARQDTPSGSVDNCPKFTAHGNNYALYLKSSEAVYALRQKDLELKIEGEASRPTFTDVRMRLVGGNSEAQITGEEALPGKMNHLIGSDPSQWRTNVTTFAKVKVEAVYPGIDLIYYGRQQQLEYDFMVAPGANPKAIKLAFDGMRNLAINGAGDLVLQTNGDEMRLHKPIAYQLIDGVRHEVAVSYLLQAGKTKRSHIKFQLGAYDHRQPLVIDPVTSFGLTFGGTSRDQAYSIAVDAFGDTYITGLTASTDFPLTTPAQVTSGGKFDVFVTKLTAGFIVYSTYLGGSQDDAGLGIAVDGSGSAYITGYTQSSDFPIKNALQPTYGGALAGQFEAGDAFVAKLNPAGNALVYSTYLGGSQTDQGTGIAVDAAGNAYITGFTDSTNFPTMNAFQPSNGGGFDAFVTKLNPAGALAYSTYLGGNGNENNLNAFPNTDARGGIAVDPSGNAYVTGYTDSANFPTKNPIQATFAGQNGGFGGDAFVTKLNPAGAALVFSTYLGGSDNEIGTAIALDTANNVYVTGFTFSTNFPTTSPIQAKSGGFPDRFNSGVNFGGDAFITKLNAAGTARVYSTYLGGGGNDAGYGIAVDAAGNAYVTGYTDSPNFPTVNGFQGTGAGSIFKSSDSGGGWLASNTGLLTSDVKTIVLDPTNSNIGYAGTGSGVYKTTNGGDAWVKTSLANSVNTLAIDPTNPAIIYAGGVFGGFFKSVNNGGAWTSINFTGSNIVALAINPVNSAIIYAGANFSGVFKSIDGGANWSKVNNGLINQNVSALILDKNNPNTLYAGTFFNDGGIFKTTDGGANWAAVSSNLPPKDNFPAISVYVNALAFSPVDTKTIYASLQASPFSPSTNPGGIFKSIDGGATWTTLVRTQFDALTMAVDPNNDNTLYLGCSAFSGRGVLKSADGGATFTEIGLNGDQITTIAVDRSDSTRLYVGSLGGSDAFVARVNAAGTAFDYASFLGGTGLDEGHGIAVYGSVANLAGFTHSKDYPSTLNKPQPAFNEVDNPIVQLEGTTGPANLPIDEGRKGLEDTVFFGPPGAPDVKLRIIKNVSEAFGIKSQLVHYTISIINFGDISSPHVRVTDSSSFSLKEEISDIGGGGVLSFPEPANDNIIVVDFPSIPSHSTSTIVLTVPVPTSLVSGIYRNTARVFADGFSGFGSSFVDLTVLDQPPPPEITDLEAESLEGCAGEPDSSCLSDTIDGNDFCVGQSSCDPKVSVGNFAATVVSKTDSKIVFKLTSSILPGAYSVKVTTPGGTATAPRPLTVTQPQTADVTLTGITQSVDKTRKQVQYTINFCNMGPNDAKNFRLNIGSFAPSFGSFAIDALPSGMECNLTTGDCIMPSLWSGQCLMLKATLTLNNNLPEAQRFLQFGPIVTSGTSDPNTNNNSLSINSDLRTINAQPNVTTVTQGTTGNVAAPPGGPGFVTGAGTNNAPPGGATQRLRARASGDLILTAQSYFSNPTTALITDVGGGFIALQASGADSNDTLTGRFYYPTAVGTAETNLRLFFFNGSTWQMVRGSGGAPPTQNTTDNLDGTTSGGRFIVLFNNTSTPRITEMAATVFTMSIGLPGDLNFDGVIDASDLVLLANGLAGNVQVDPIAADTFLDGAINAADLVTLANYLAGNINSLPVISVGSANNVAETPAIHLLSLFSSHQLLIPTSDFVQRRTGFLPPWHD